MTSCTCYQVHQMSKAKFQLSVSPMLSASCTQAASQEQRKQRKQYSIKAEVQSSVSIFWVLNYCNYILLVCPINPI